MVICTLIVLLCIGCACSVYHIHISRCTILDDDDISEWGVLKCPHSIRALAKKIFLKICTSHTGLKNQ